MLLELVRDQTLSFLYFRIDENQIQQRWPIRRVSSRRNT